MRWVAVLITAGLLVGCHNLLAVSPQPGPDSGTADGKGPVTEASRGDRPIDLRGRDAAVLDAPALDRPKPDASSPDAPPRDAAAADVAKPDTLRPDTFFKPDAPKPDTFFQPDLFKPDAPKPDTLKPDLFKPDAPKPDSFKPDAKPDTVAASCPAATAACGTEWCAVSPGCFMMGAEPSDPCYYSDELKHQVTLSSGFQIGLTEVSRGAFTSLMTYTPAVMDPKCQTDDCAMGGLNWHEAAAYCTKLSTSQGMPACYSCQGNGTSVSCVSLFPGKSIYACKGYRLPTETEFEMAMRAGTTTPLYTGQTVTKCWSNDTAADAIGWYSNNSANSVHTVKSKPFNPWGIYGMAGNLAEWVHDGYVADLGAAAVIDPFGNDATTEGITRGGAYSAAPLWMRSAARLHLSRSLRGADLGVRCARTFP